MSWRFWIIMALLGVLALACMVAVNLMTYGSIFP